MIMVRMTIIMVRIMMMIMVTMTIIIVIMIMTRMMMISVMVTSGKLGTFSERKTGLCGKSSQAADPPSPQFGKPLLSKKSWGYFSF